VGLDLIDQQGVKAPTPNQGDFTFEVVRHRRNEEKSDEE
jgi:hypothetical protein